MPGQETYRPGRASYSGRGIGAEDMPSKTRAKVEESTEVAEVVEMNRSMAMGTRQDAVSSVQSLTALREVFGSELVDWQSIEPSFPIFDKEQLIGVPFVIGGFRMNESTKFMTPDEVNPDILNPGRFLSLLVALYDEDSGDIISPWGIVNDGSTGVCRSLIEMVKRKLDPEADLSKERFNRVSAQVPPITCSNGLRPSDYSKELEVNGKKQVIEARTYYIA